MYVKSQSFALKNQVAGLRFRLTLWTFVWKRPVSYRLMIAVIQLTWDFLVFKIFWKVYAARPLSCVPDQAHVFSLKHSESSTSAVPLSDMSSRLGDDCCSWSQFFLLLCMVRRITKIRTLIFTDLLLQSVTWSSREHYWITKSIVSFRVFVTVDSIVAKCAANFSLATSNHASRLLPDIWVRRMKKGILPIAGVSLYARSCASIHTLHLLMFMFIP